MERYNGVSPPFICSSCPKKTFGDCHSLLIHSVLAHDKGQLISKCPFGVFKSQKKTMTFTQGFLP